MSIASTALLAPSAVVEISRGVTGAYCGLTLARLGAEVARCDVATILVGTAPVVQAMQRVFHDAKRLLPCDGSPLDAALAHADIVIVESEMALHPQLGSRVRGLIEGRLGLAPAAVLVVLSANGAASDLRIEGCSLTSSASAGISFAIGNPAEEPLAPAYDITDYQAGINGACAAIAGMLRDEGAAETIDVASRDVVANLVGTLALNYLPYGRPWRREGTRPSMSGGVYPCGLFPCKDGYVAIYCRSTAEWHSVLEAMGNPAWSLDERFRDPKIVAMHLADEADRHFLGWLGGYTRAELLALGMRFGFPVAPVRYVREALGDEQFAHRQSFDSLALDPGQPPLKVPATPWRLQEIAAPLVPSRPAPVHRQTGPEPGKILSGLRVLDFTWVWSGPMVTSILADLGAEVIKVEHPSHLDSLRTRGRPLRNGVEVEGPTTDVNPWFNQLNHGKKSLIADIKSPSGQEALKRLASTCDVVVENMRPGALSQSGLGYADLAQANPGLVMLSMSMAGQSGPLARMKGYAGIMTSMAGLESIVGYASPEVDARFTGMTMTALGDPNGAAHGVAVLLAALRRRRTTGRGVWIDLAQTDAMLSIMGAPVLESQLHGHVTVRGNAHPAFFPHGHYRCLGEDRWLALSVRDDTQWQALASTVGGALAAWGELDLASRQARRVPIEAAVRDWIGVRTLDVSLSLFEGCGLTAAPVASYEEFVASDWLRQRGISQESNHLWLGPQTLFVVPWLFGGRPAGVAAPSPLLGEHSSAIWDDLAEREAGAARAQDDIAPTAAEVG